MRNRFTITISDISGSRSYDVHQIVKKIVIYTILITISLFVIGGYSISFLISQVEELTSKKELMSEEYQTLQRENEILSEKILQKSEDLDAISNKVNDIEGLIGLRFNENLTLNERVDLAKFTTAEKQHIIRQIPNGYPIENSGINSQFGWRTHPILKKKEFHSGLDLKANMNTKVYATADGVVEYAGKHSSSGYGNLIIMSHSFGFKSFFAHLDKINVEIGDIISQGDLIGESGSSGLSNGPHLHYEVKYINMPLDPMNFVEWNMQNYETIFEKEKKVKWQSLINLINKVAVQQSSQKGES